MTEKCINDQRKIEPEDLYELRFVGDPQVSPDGQSVAFVVTEVDSENNGYRSCIWVAETDNPDSIRQFTHPPSGDGPVRDHSPRWSPDGKSLAFLSNRLDSNCLWIIGRDGGEARPVGDFAGPASGLKWSPTGNRLTFTALPPDNDSDCCHEADVYVTERLRYKFNGRGLMDDDRRRHVWVTDVTTGETTQMTDSPFDDSSPDWSPDGRQIIFSSCRHPEQQMYYVSDLYALSVEDDQLKRLTDGEGPVQQPRWSPCGEHIAFLGHDCGDEIAVDTGLWYISPGDGERISLTADLDRSVGNSVGTDVRYDAKGTEPEWCRDGRSIIFNLTDGGTSSLYEAEPDGSCRLLTDQSAVVTSYSVNSTGDPVVAYVGAEWDSPGDLWIIRPDGERPVRFTDFNDHLLRGEVVLSAPQRITFSAAEGPEIEGWLMKPVGWEHGNEYPLVLEIHGGPAGTSGEVFFHEYQLLAASGWGVMFTNPRGSRGYGEQHLKGVIGDWGGDDYSDLMAAVDYACDLPWVDNERLGVTGGSYGGYMTNWIVSQTDRFSAAVTFRSISNLYTKYGCSDIGFYGNRRGMGGADLWDSEDFIMSRSPMRYAPQVSTPILIVHAEEDYRCPMEQAEQWYVALKRLGVECRFVRYEGENHELSRSGKPLNRVDRLQRLLQWFETYL